MCALGADGWQSEQTHKSLGHGSVQWTDPATNMLAVIRSTFWLSWWSYRFCYALLCPALIICCWCYSYGLHSWRDRPERKGSQQLFSFFSVFFPVPDDLIFGVYNALTHSDITVLLTENLGAVDCADYITLIADSICMVVSHLHSLCSHKLRWNQHHLGLSKHGMPQDKNPTVWNV